VRERWSFNGIFGCNQWVIVERMATNELNEFNTDEAAGEQRLPADGPVLSRPVRGARAAPILVPQLKADVLLLLDLINPQIE
jgi:hypothetical protein